MFCNETSIHFVETFSDVKTFYIRFCQLKDQFNIVLVLSTTYQTLIWNRSTYNSKGPSEVCECAQTVPVSVTVHQGYLVVKFGLGRNLCIHRQPYEHLVASVVQFGIGQNNGTCVFSGSHMWRIHVT